MRVETIPEPDTELEANLKDILAQLHRDYLRAAEPYMRQLVALQAAKPMRSIIIPEEGDVSWPTTRTDKA